MAPLENLKDVTLPFFIIGGKMDINDPAFAKTIGDEDYDKTDPSSGMSIKVYAAIHLKVPDSGIQELDAMIRKAKRDEIAMAALNQYSPQEFAGNAEDQTQPEEAAYSIADAMLEQSEKEKISKKGEKNESC